MVRGRREFLLAITFLKLPLVFLVVRVFSAVAKGGDNYGETKVLIDEFFIDISIVFKFDAFVAI